jgi:hypothetical protein
LIRVMPGAQDDRTRLDEEEPETIEKHREREKREG